MACIQRPRRRSQRYPLQTPQGTTTGSQGRGGILRHPCGSSVPSRGNGEAASYSNAEKKLMGQHKIGDCSIWRLLPEQLLATDDDWNRIDVLSQCVHKSLSLTISAWIRQFVGTMVSYFGLINLLLTRTIQELTHSFTTHLLCSKRWV